MTIYYCQVKDGTVVNRIVFDDSNPMPADWPEYATWAQNNEAQIGWTYANGAFTAPLPPPVLPPIVPPYPDPNLRIDAGVLAALGTVVAAAAAIHNIPATFTAQNFVTLLTQIKITCDAFVSMLQAQAKTSSAGNGGKPPDIGKPQ